MRIAEVIGTVTLSRVHPSLRGGRLRLIIPLSLAHLQGRTDTLPDVMVSYDDLGAGIGQYIAISEGAEAAQPFRPNLKPIDTYTAAILDRVELSE